MRLSLWARIRDSLWFVPGLIVLLAVALAVSLVELGGSIGADAAARWPYLFGAGAEGSRGMLTAIATSMITVAGVVFSITIVTLSLAASQYSSRVLRNFMTDRTNQAVLGVFVGIFAYCLVVLRTIRGGDQPFVPALGVLGGIVLAFVGIGYLVYFIHHIAAAIQASHILAAVTAETLRTVERVCPARLAPGEDDAPVAALDGGRHGVPVPRDGYVQRVDANGLTVLARELDCVIRIFPGVGDFVVEGTALAELDAPPDAELAGRIQARVEIGRQRMLDQDVGYGIRQIVDLALKALSPGINDTTSAVMAVDYLAAILSRVTCRRLPPPHRYDGNALRVTLRVPTYDGLVGEALDQIRRHGEGNVAVQERVLWALELLARTPAEGHRRRTLARQAQRLREAVRRSIPWTEEREALERRADRLLVELDSAPVPMN